MRISGLLSPASPASRSGAAAAEPIEKRGGETERETESNPAAHCRRASSATSTQSRGGKTQQVRSDCPTVSAAALLFFAWLFPLKMSVGSDFGNPLRKFKLVFLGEQSGKSCFYSHLQKFVCREGELAAPARLQLHPACRSGWKALKSESELI